MNTSKNEFLSALLDDEAGEFERRRLLDELNQDDELGQTLGRYALVGEVMRTGNNTVLKDNRDFLAGIHAELEDEPEYSETVVQFADTLPAANDRVWRKNALRAGMAASVVVAALAGVLLLQPDNEPSTTTEMASAVSASGTAASQPVLLSSAESNTATKLINSADSSRIRQSNKHLDRETRDALKQYVTLHMQHRANNGIVPSIQAVSYSK